MKFLSRDDNKQALAFGRLAQALAVGGAAFLAYLRWICPWQLR